MSKKSIIFFIFIQLALVVGCADDAPRRERLITKQAELTTGLPLVFPRANSADCSDTTSPIDGGEIFSLTQFQVSNDSIVFENLLGSPSIKNSIVKNTRIGSKWQRECGPLEEHSGGPICNREGTNIEINFLLTEMGTPLQACDRIAEFPRESPEAVAITTAHYLEESHETFKRNFPELTLKKVELEIFPVFESIFDYFYKPENRQTTLGFYDANNLAYLPNQKKIAVYPVKEKKDIYLWDSRFPAGHEMAHHVDYSTSQTYRDCRIGVDDIGSDSSYLSQKVCGAEAEALADLLAFATWPNLEDHLFGLQCLDALRNIKNNRFKNTDEKVLNNKILSYFYELTSFQLKQDTNGEDVFGNSVLLCERPDYREIHTIGAIQGHHIYHLTMLAVQALGIESELDRSDFLYKIVVRTMRRLNNHYKKIPLQGLGRIYYAFQSVLNNTLNKSSLTPIAKRTLKTNICMVSRQQTQDIGFNVYQNWCSQ